MSHVPTASLKQRGYHAVTDRLPPALAAWLDWHLVPQWRQSFGGPFNGQRQRTALFHAVLNAVPCQALVETGSHRGTTTAFLHAATGLPVHTVEADARAHRYARRRFRGTPGIHLEHGDSRRFLERLARNPAFPRDRVFFYLDAHWGADLPLPQELALIAQHWSNPVILVDDFEVPGDPGYGFDDYGPNQRLSRDCMLRGALTELQVLYPSAHSSTESGAKRGCVVLVRAPETATILAALPHLRWADGGHAHPGNDAPNRDRAR
jgi:hypothetical protein